MAYVQAMSGPVKGQKFEIDRDTVVVGRSHDNLICLDTPSVSGKHCAIIRDGRRFTLQDLDSTNGTRLNDVRVKEFRLSPKDIITVGDVKLRFDGTDVEAIETGKNEAVPDTQVTVRLSTTTQRQAMGTTAIPFKKKKDSKAMWVSLIVVVLLLALAAGGWFIYKLNTN